MEEEYFYDGFLVHQFDKKSHTDAVLDICEIVSPLLIATACMDKAIRLYMLKDHKLIGIFNGHIKGCRQLDYTSYHEGFILSVGYENYANVWSLEGGMGAIQSSINLEASGKTNSSSNLSGKLSNVNNILRFARFISNSPFSATVDEKFVVKLWNFQTFQQLQTIQ